MRRFHCYVVAVLMLMQPLMLPMAAYAEDSPPIGSIPGTNPDLKPHPNILEAKALINQLPALARLAREARSSYDYALRASLVPKFNQLIDGVDLPAPPVDPGRCRKYSTPLPITTETTTDTTTRSLESETTAITETSRTTETTEYSYWDSFRTEYYDVQPEVQATETIETRETMELTDQSAWDSFRGEAITSIESEPVIGEQDLCTLLEERNSQETDFDANVNQVTALLTYVLKISQWKTSDYIQAAEVYQTALTTLYLNGRLRASPQQGTACVDLNLLDFNLLSPPKFPDYWTLNTQTYAKDYGLRSLIMQIGCLSDKEAMRLVNAFSNAWRNTQSVVQATQPKKAGEIQKAMMSDYLPLFVALFDRTKAAGPGNPLYKLLLDVRKAQGTTQDYGVPHLLLFNPATQKHEEAPVCDMAVVNNASSYFYEKYPNEWVPGPTPTLQQMMGWMLEGYNYHYKTGKGPRSIYGASYAALIDEEENAPAIVLITDAMTPNILSTPCIYLPNFMQTLLHPIPLGDANCAAWDTARVGKICKYKPVPVSVSQREPNEEVNWEKIANQVEQFILPVAHAEDIKTGACFIYDENTGETKVYSADSIQCQNAPCPCGYEDVTTCMYNAEGVQICSSAPSKKCKICGSGGGSPADAKLACKDICRYRHGMSYAGGEEKVLPGYGCYLLGSLVDATKVDDVVVIFNDPCVISAAVKKSTINPSAYNACLEKGSCCGNGVVEEGEDCDDGNGVTTDQCNNFCVKSSDCKSACNFGYQGPATKALKAIVDARTNFHPVYRWLGTGLFFQSEACKLPYKVSDGKVTLEQGKPCKEIMVPLLKIVQAEQTACVKQCQAANPNLPPPSSQKAAECYQVCSPEKQAECKAAKQYYAKMVEPGCTLANGVTKGEKQYCAPGAPCTCGWDFVLEPCKQIVAACKADCATKYNDALHNDELGEICSGWTQIQGDDANTSAMNWFQETEGTKKELGQFAKPSTVEEALKVAKDAGSKKFDALFGTMMDWVDYDHFSVLPTEQRDLVKAAAKYSLSMMSTCDGFRSKMAQAKIKGNLSLLAPAVIGPVVVLALSEVDKYQPMTTSKTVYDSTTADYVTFEYWKKADAGGVEKAIKTYILNSPGMDDIAVPIEIVKEALVKDDIQATAWSMELRSTQYTVVEKIVPKLKIFAILGKASLVGDFYDMAGDTPIKPEFEMATQLQLCVNPEGLDKMSPEDLAKLGAQQALVAAMQFQDWVRKDTMDNLHFDEIVDSGITNSVEYMLEKLGIKIPKTNNDPEMMTTVCDTYFSSGS